MDRSRISGWVVVILLAIPPILVGLLSQLYPNLTLWLVVGLAVFWVLSFVIYLLLRISTLQAKVDSLETTKTESEGKQAEKKIETNLWKVLEELDLFLEGWQATQVHHFEKDSTIRVSAKGDKRFKVHLAFLESKRKFTPLRSSPETKNWSGPWDINSDAYLAIVIAPTGSSPFWVHVKLEQEEKLIRGP